jgi:hypothetical protein
MMLSMLPTIYAKTSNGTIGLKDCAAAWVKVFFFKMNKPIVQNCHLKQGQL